MKFFFFCFRTNFTSLHKFLPFPFPPLQSNILCRCNCVLTRIIFITLFFLLFFFLSFVIIYSYLSFGFSKI